MTTSEREGYTLVAIGVALSVCGLIYFFRFEPFDWSNYAALFLSGFSLGMALGAGALLRQRMRLNKFFGYDIWEKVP